MDRDYLVQHLAHGKRGIADLCSYFFLRASKLARQEAMCALLATNTIAQGDTREVGLDQIVASNWAISRAISSRKWPGEANLEVAYIWLRSGSWNGTFLLDDQDVTGISSSLTSIRKLQGEPYPLKVNSDKY